MSAYSTPGPMYRVRWAPRRSRTRSADCRLLRRRQRNTTTWAASTVPVAGQQPTARDDVHSRPNRVPAPPLRHCRNRFPLTRIRFAHLELHSLDGRDGEFDPGRLRRPPACDAVSRVVQMVSRASSLSNSRCESGSACTRIFGTGGCQLSEHSTPSSGAAKAISCQRAPITAAAKANPAQVASARVSCDARQRNSTSWLSITPRPPCASLRSRNRQAPEQFRNYVGTLDLSHPHLGPQRDPMRTAAVASAFTSSGIT